MPRDIFETDHLKYYTIYYAQHRQTYWTTLARGWSINPWGGFLDV